MRQLPALTNRFNNAILLTEGWVPSPFTTLRPRSLKLG